MSKYITGQEIIRDLGLQDFEFYNDYVRAGLTPLNHLGQPYSPLDVMAQLFNLTGQREALFQLNDSIHDLDDESVGALRANRIIPLEQAIGKLEARLAALEGVDWADFELPNNQSEAQHLLDIIQASLFDRLEVVKLVGGEAYSQKPKNADQPNDKVFSDIPGIKDLDIMTSDDANVKDIEDAVEFAGEKKTTKSVKAKHKGGHHTVPDKLWIQAKARELKDGDYKDYFAPQLADTEEIKKLSKKKNGKSYRREKVIEWINKVLTDDEKLKGAPPKLKKSS